MIPVGALAAGSVASWYGPRAALWCTAGATLAVATLVPTSPIRTRREMAGRKPMREASLGPAEA